MDKREFKVRASGASHIVAQPRSKKDKEAGLLAESVKTHVRDVFLSDFFGYRETVVTDIMTKGHLMETESRKLVQAVLGGETRMRNVTQFDNDFARGTPDIVMKDCVEDIKNPWSLRTFFNASITPAYYWQAQVYMWLTEVHKFRLIYTLNPTPFELIQNEKNRLFYKFEDANNNPDYEEACKQIDHNNDLILQLPEEFRVKVFDIEYNQTDIDFLMNQILRCRKYYKELEASL